MDSTTLAHTISDPGFTSLHPAVQVVLIICGTALAAFFLYGYYKFATGSWL